MATSLAPPSLVTLPSELVSGILDNITSPATLCKLARCSRRLQLCTMPHLYRHVTVKTNKGTHRKEHLKAVAALLIRRPDLAGLVRSFSIHLIRRPWTELDWVDLARLMDQVIQAGAENSEEAEESHDEAWVTPGMASSLSAQEKLKCLGQFSHDHKSHHDFILALLLPTLLKVEKLVLDMQSSYDTHYLEEIIRRAAYRETPFDVQPPFQALTALVLSDDCLILRSPVLAASLLKLPAMQEISGGFGTLRNKRRSSTLMTAADRGLPADESLTELDSSSSTVTSLSLAPYRLCPAQLGHILRVPKSLKALSFKFSPPLLLDFTGIRQALKPQESCLESLTFDTILPSGWGLIGSRPLPSFISFNNLKVFKSAPFFFTPNGAEGFDRFLDIFPPSLEALHVTHLQASFRGVLEALVHLLTKKSARQIPSLTRVVLEETFSHGTRLRAKRGVKPKKLIDVLWRDTAESAVGRLSEVGAAKDVSVDLVEEWIEVKSPSREMTDRDIE